MLHGFSTLGEHSALVGPCGDAVSDYTFVSSYPGLLRTDFLVQQIIFLVVVHLSRRLVLLNSFFLSIVIFKLGIT